MNVGWWGVGVSGIFLIDTSYFDNEFLLSFYRVFTGLVWVSVRFHVVYSV